MTRRHGKPFSQEGLTVRFPAEHAIWKAMVARCTNPRNKRYSRYGGRGISVHPRWRDFSVFLLDLGPRPPSGDERWLLDRIDNDGNYEPGNVRWVLERESIRNRSNSKFVTWQGQRMWLADVCKAEGVSASSVSTMMKFHGKSIEQSIAALKRRKAA